MNIQTLVEQAGMDDSAPGFFSGRGATKSDLNEKILSKIADLLKTHYGDEAHDAFVEMVWKMPVLSANAFLVNLYALNGNNWDLSKVAIAKSDDYIESEAGAFAVLAAALTKESSPKRDDTEAIRSGFRKLVKS